MQRNMIGVAVLSFALSALPTLAQSPSPTGGEQKATSSQFPTQLKEGQWRGSKINGLSVYNNNAKKIGSIEDLVVAEDGKIDAFVIGMGGFLGIGKHQVAVPFEEMKFVNEPVIPPPSPTAGISQLNSPKTDPNNATQNQAPQNPALLPEQSAPKTAYDLPDHAVVNMTEKQLKAAPQFTYALNN
jgi:sporulation protein YlmC with PRC-barrel domain